MLDTNLLNRQLYEALEKETSESLTNWLSNRRKKTKMIVYAFNHCPCIHESGTVTISLHKTKKGAEIAMEFHKENERKEHEEYLNRLDKKARKFADPFDRGMWWGVEEVEVLE